MQAADVSALTASLLQKRTVFIQFAFDMTADYELYEFLPHSAAVVFDLVFTDDDDDGTKDPLSGRTTTALFGAILFVTMKLVDCKIVRIEELAACCCTTESEITRAEEHVFAEICEKIIDCELQQEKMLFAQIKKLRLAPDRVENIIKFFNLSVFGAFRPTRRNRRRA